MAISGLLVAYKWHVSGDQWLLVTLLVAISGLLVAISGLFVAY